MYVILGGTGNTGKQIAETLLAAGKAVTIVSRDAAKAQDLVAKGAKVAIGDLHDSDFLTQTFRGATAVYSLVPPKWDVQDWRAFQTQIATAITLAVHSAKVPYVVNLSSMGAHLPEGAGPVSGLYYLEQMLNNVPGLNVLHLRPGYFYQNFYGFLDMIKHMGVLAQPLAADHAFTMVHTSDIANVAAQRLLALDFKRNSVQFISGPRNYSFGEAAALIGKATGTEVPFVSTTTEQSVEGMIGAGLPTAIAEGYGDLYKAINQRSYTAGFDPKTNVSFGEIALEQFIENELKYALVTEAV
jgi:uncharacterized protein YbjT (DUF2867 family)